MFRQIQRGIDFVKPTLVIWPMARCFGLPVGKVSGQFALWNNLLQCVLYMEIATMCVIRELCYNVCYTWRLLQCVLYGDFATVCVICELCYSVCYTWTLLQCVLYVDFATLCVICELCCVIHGLCYIMCYTWTLLQCVLYVDFQNQFATICVLCVLCEHQSFETRCFIISIWIVYLGFSDQHMFIAQH